MRIERTGSVAKITPRVERFLSEALAGQRLDDVQSPNQRRADFSCLRGLLVVELKTLEEDASERMEHLTDELRERPDWPAFLASAPMQSFIRHLKDPDDVKRRVVERLGRAIKNHIAKANKQLAAHEIEFPRRAAAKVVVLVNEDHEIYDPKMVGYIVHHLLTRRNEDGNILYPNVDAVFFFTERHATRVEGLIAFPMLVIEGQPIQDALWKREVLDHFSRTWGSWSGVPLFQSEFREDAPFETIDHIPERMKRHEKWELDYRRKPYMRQYSKENVRGRFDEIMCISSLAFIIGAPFKPPKEAIAWSMESMSHIMIEMGHRSIPATEFKLEPDRLAAAAKRLGFPPEAAQWLMHQQGKSAA